ncbi:hypothetical protein HRS9122_08047 [Pyrenophora teres f. teres]|nr:hypothetical protein HRS9122_08047 [Pyrenophora teres f. teres]
MVGNIFSKALVVSLRLFSRTPISSPETVTTLEDIQNHALTNAYKVLDGTLSDGLTRSPNTSCTKATLAIRKELSFLPPFPPPTPTNPQPSGDLTPSERKAYTTAVTCLLTSPSKLPPTTYPGAKSRYDDFTVVHMNMTPTVHSTANFLHWHRYFIWAYESALRTECAYTGYQPYWNWARYPDLVHSPMYAADEYSMGGNGDAVGPHANLTLGPGQTLPAGPGGGCVTTGPFANLTIHLGPVFPTVDAKFNISANPLATGYGDNPRCLRRDVSNFLPQKYLTPDRLVRHVTSNTDIRGFQHSLQLNVTDTFAALHVAGHYSVWGDPGGDVFVSPGDPVFWLHHAQVDRHWWMWALWDEAEVGRRTGMYDGGTNWFDPNSRKGTPEDEQELGVVAPEGMNNLKANDLFSTTAGPFCYVYV